MTLRILSVLFILLLSPDVFAQPGTSPIELIEGKKFYKHQVSKGQTVYGISKMYSVTQEEIYATNPDVEKEGIKSGATLLIPVKGEVNIPAQNVVKPPQGSYVEHTVKRGETFYSITKKYKTTPDKIITFNGLAADYVLQPGDVLLIPSESIQAETAAEPQPATQKNETDNRAIKHTIQKGETVYSLTKKYKITEKELLQANDSLPEGLRVGEIIYIPARANAVEAATTPISISSHEGVLKEKYKVAVLLPFMLDHNRAEQEKCPTYGDCPMYGVTKNALEMYMGIELALDSIRKRGLNLEVFVHDTRNDSITLATILSNEDILSADLIIGPIFPDRVNQTARFAKANGIRMVCPVPAPNRIIFNNHYVTKVMSSTPTQADEMASFIAHRYSNENIILMKNVTGSDAQLYKIIKTRINDDLKKQPIRFKDSTSTASSGSNMSDLKPKLREDKLNVIIVPSENLSYVSNFLTRLNGVYNSGNYFKYQYKVFGLEEWNRFSNLDFAYLNKFSVNLASGHHVNYEADKTIALIKEYRAKYKTDPSYYAMIGYDIALYHFRGLQEYGGDFDTYYADYKWEGVCLGFDLRKPEQGSGYENYKVQVLEYSDLHLVRQNP